MSLHYEVVFSCFLDDETPPDVLDAGDAYQWGLHSRNYWLDDDMGDLVAILDLLAPHVVEDGHGGHVREEYDTEFAVFEFRDGSYVRSLAH